ncbi:FadR family transcriptional regulator [Sphingomonas cannabina]|uniref:FadR/GntR family transcriptional regulator n=1 Tax=Sphingomonas cannabina TaxID=2899123 RepID=UPI001F307FBB|nr:FadR/GntR family transcriptional regulator [Sphingomonas cannabina]UIJ47303.1 FadR family transcriptional regulator [Sphingomonas cannabina]
MKEHRNDKLYRAVCDSVLSWIRQGRHPKGDRLPTERELAELHGVSRTTVREAMVALEMAGVVEIRKGSGIYVVGLDRVWAPLPELDIGAFELIEARRLFEGEAAALAAVSISDTFLAELERLLEAMHDPDSLKAEAADREFHLTIARATGNSVIQRTVESLWDMRDRSPLARNILTRARHCGFNSRISEHEEILAALRRRDSRAARKTMRSHLERVIDHLLQVTENDAVEAAREQSAELRNRLLQQDA